jgi:hypothetical protein
MGNHDEGLPPNVETLTLGENGEFTYIDHINIFVHSTLNSSDTSILTGEQATRQDRASYRANATQEALSF